LTGSLRTGKSSGGLPLAKRKEIPGLPKLRSGRDFDRRADLRDGDGGIWLQTTSVSTRGLRFAARDGVVIYD